MPNKPNREELIASLLADQQYRCAYCCAILKPETTRVEHWAIQSENPELTLTYSNLLAVCYGDRFCGDGHHCDRSREPGTALTITPLRQSHVNTLSFGDDGKITSTDAALQHDLDSPQRLNLNCDRLSQHRSTLLLNFKISLRASNSRGKKINFPTLLANQLASQKSFNDIIIHYLSEKIRKEG